MTTNRGRILGLGAIVAIALLLAGCAQAPAGLASSPSAVAEAPAQLKTDSPDHGTAADAEPGAPTPGMETTTPGAASSGEASSGEACLAGNWKMDNDVFAKTMLKMIKADAEAGKVTQDIRAAGDRSLWFSGDGTYGEVDDKFVLTIVAAAGGRTIDVVTTIDSARGGTYGVVDGFLWVAEMETLFEDGTMTVDGETVSVSTEIGGPTDYEVFGFSGQIPNVTEDYDLEGVAIYRCSGNELELEADGGLISRFTRTK